MEWSPDGGLLHQSVMLLQALSDPSRHDHQSALEALKREVASPDCVLHLLHVFSKGGDPQLIAMGLSNELRQLSGLIVKNYAFPHFGAFAPHVQLLIERSIHQALSDPLVDIRQTACILIGKIASTFPMNVWSPLLHTLLHHLDSTVYLEVDGALSALRLICEDACDRLVTSPENVLSLLIPKLFGLFKHSEQIFRLHAIQTLIAILNFIPASTQPVPLNANTFISELSVLANDASPMVSHRSFGLACHSF